MLTCQMPTLSTLRRALSLQLSLGGLAPSLRIGLAAILRRLRRAHTDWHNGRRAIFVCVELVEVSLPELDQLENTQISHAQ